MNSPKKTSFAAAEREPQEIVLEQFQAFLGTHCRAFFDALPTMILTLNRNRQVVFANKAAVEFLGRAEVEQLLGARPGEALGCVNAPVGIGGCGTSVYCRNCGAVRAILDAIGGAMSGGECKLFRREKNYLEGLDLHVNATPLNVDGTLFVIFAITDISHEMRRRNMERIFFHDVLNLAGGINGLVEVLRLKENLGDSTELSVLHSATQTLVDEIIAQRELAAAESDELRPSYSLAGTRRMLEQLVTLYATSPAAQGQELLLDEPVAELVIETDERIAQRVLGNMIKNALEAGALGDVVRLACVDEGERVRFEVKNAAAIPAGIQTEIFRRRFSTKGDARGLGTYSMLLLTERYLCGEVGFRSSEGQGTTFHLILPKQLGNV